MKNMSIFSTTVLAFATLLLFSQHSRAQKKMTALEIMDTASKTRKLDGSEAVMTLTIINKKGQKRIRKTATVTKLFDGGKTEKRLIRFLDPPDVKGTGFMTFDYEDKDVDMWIFLLAIRKTRRIVSSDKSKSFMGSEFAYGDMNIPVLEDYNYKILREEKLNGVDCWVIESLPKKKETAKDDGYSKKISWISKDHFNIHKGEYHDLDGKLLKILTVKEFKLLDPEKKRYRPMNMEMVNKQNGRKSIFRTNKIEFTPDTKDEYFSIRYLERQ